MTAKASVEPRHTARACRCRSASSSPILTLIRVPTSTPERRIVDGRPVINRAELCRQTGVSMTTAERWWRQRESNGHPPAALVDGRRLFWDEAAVIDFARAQPEVISASGEDTVVVGGRTLVGRRRLAAALAMNEATHANLYSQRHENGHPEHAAKFGKRLFWDEAQVLKWDEARRAAARARLTPVDRSGDPDELVGLDEGARVLGFADQRTLTSVRARYPDRFPPPDDEDGRYKRRTLWAYADARATVGRPRGAGRRDQR
jgi:hypothetical protein